MTAPSIQTRRASLTLAALATLGLAATSAHAQKAFTTGDIVVSRFGDGSAALSGAGAATFLDEYTTSGTLVQSIAVSGLVNSGSAGSEGALSLSANGQYLTLAGYNAPVGTAGVATSTTIARGVAEVGANGVVSTSFFSDSSFSGSNIRSTASTDGGTIYATGGTGGVRSTAFGSGTTAQVESATANTRVTNIVNGSMYFSTGSATGNAGIGVYTMGPLGSPLAAPTALFTEAAGASPYDFYFANANTLFVADDRTTAAGGLQEYTNTGSGFSLLTTFNLSGLTAGTTAGLRGLTGNGTDLFGVSTDNRLVDFNLASGTFTTVATGATNTAFRGLDFAPAAAPPAVPEASTTASFGLLLALGLGGIIVARRRKQA